MEVTTKKHKEILPVYVKGLYNHKYTLKQASVSTGYSVDHLCRLRKKYALYGNKIFEHANKGKTPANKLDSKMRSKIACIYSGSYADVNFSYFQKCLRDYENEQQEP